MKVRDVMSSPAITVGPDTRSIVFRVAPGTKLHLSGVGAPVAFEVDEASDLFETAS